MLENKNYKLQPNILILQNIMGTQNLSLAGGHGVGSKWIESSLKENELHGAY